MRAGAAALLGGSAALAWIVGRWGVGRRLVQLWTAGSLAYTVVLAWRGGKLMRDARMANGEESFSTGEADGLPFVTLMVPARDEAAVIRDVVADLLAQRYARSGRPHYEVLVIDDGSRDGTGDRAREALGSARAPLRVLRRPPGSGPELRGAALNYATPFATGEIIVAIDADATVAPDFVERAMRAWQRYPEAAALQVQKRPVNAGTNWLTAAQLEELLLDMASQGGRWSAGGAGELRGNGMFIRREVLDRLGGWGQDALTEDLDMSTRLVAAGERIAVAPEVSVGEQAVELARPLWHQRMRWAEGSLRRTITHGRALASAPISLTAKLDAMAFLVSESALPSFLAALVVGSALRPPARQPRWRLPAQLVAAYTAGLAALALAGLAADGRRGTTLAVGAVRGAFFLAHWLVIVPAALVRLVFGPGRILYVKTPRIAPPGGISPAGREGADRPAAA